MLNKTDSTLKQARNEIISMPFTQCRRQREPSQLCANANNMYLRTLLIVAAIVITPAFILIDCFVIIVVIIV